MPRIALIILALLPLAAQEKAVATQPHIIHRVDPKYTKEAQDKKIEGDVVLKLIVGADGRAKNIEVVKSLDPELDVNAIDCVKEWRFEPGKTKSGAPVDVSAKIYVNFRLP